MPGWQPRGNSAWSSTLRPRARLLAAAGPPGSSGPRPPHVLASPPGTTAPLGAINYTPKTNQIHPPGQMAPVDELNYSLLPAEGGGMGTGQEQGIAGAMGQYGTAPAGQGMFPRYTSGPSQLNNTFAPGQPPLSPHPYGTGPGPRTPITGPGSRPFAERNTMRGNLTGFGAGQSEDLSPDQLQALEDQLPAAQGQPTPQQDAPQQAQPQTQQAPQAQQAQPSADDAAAISAQATVSQGNEAPPPGWHSEGSPNDPQGKPSQLWWVSNDSNKRMYIGSFQYGLPGTPPRFVRATAAEQQQISQGIDFTKATAAKSNTTSTQTLVINGKPHRVQITTDPSGKEVSRNDLGETTGPATTTPKTTAQKVQAVPGLGVLVEQPDGSMQLDQQLTTAYNQAQANKDTSAQQVEAQRAQTTLNTDKPYSTFVDKQGATWLLNQETGDSYPITPSDPLNGIFTAGNQLVQVDPDTGQANVVYSAPHNWSVTTSGGTTFAYDPQDPTNHVDIATDSTYAPQAAATLDQTKANTQKLLQDVTTGQISNEDAKVKLAQQAHDLLHPSPIAMGTSDWLLPPGVTMNVQQGVDGGMQSFGGGSIDPESQALAGKINDFLGRFDQAAPQTAQPSVAQTTPTTASQATQDTGALTTDTTTGTTTSKPLLQPGMAGTATGDPSLSSTGVPSSIFPASDVQQGSYGALTGSLSDLTQQYGISPTPQIPRTQITTNPRVGSTLGVGLRSRPGDLGVSGGAPASGALNLGTGQDTFMGRGLTPATGRGSTGIGWEPLGRRGWSAGAGHTSAGGFGASGMSGGGGAGQSEGDQQVGPVQLSNQPQTTTRYIPSQYGQLPILPDPSPQDQAQLQQFWQQTLPSLPGQAVNWLKQRVGAGQGQAASPHLTDHLYHFAMARRNAQQQQNMGAGAVADPTLGQGNRIMPTPAATPGTRPEPTPTQASIWPQFQQPEFALPPASQQDAAKQAGQLAERRQYPILGPMGLGLWDPRIGSKPDDPEEATQTGPSIADPLGMWQNATAGKMPWQDNQGAGQDEGMPPTPDPMAGAMPGPMPGPAGGPPVPPPAGAAAGQPAGASPPSPMAGWTPPVPPQAVAGIGHRFGQAMNEGEPQHSGVDLQAPEGTPTISPVDGMVSRVEHNPQGLGLTVVIQGKDGTEHRLGHLSRTEAFPGMLVAQGQDLQSKVGSSGNTTGAHLHWGVRDGQGQPQDPTAALGPMANMPPVPGTEQMGPPGGTPGPGGPPPGGPPPAAPAGPPPMQGAGQDANSPDYQAGYQAGMQATKSPGTPPIFVPGMAQPIPSASDASGDASQQQQQQQQGGAGQESADTRWDLYEAKDTQGFWGPPGQPPLGSGGEGGMGAGQYSDILTASQTQAAKQSTAALNAQTQVAQQQLQANIQAENDRHQEALAQLQQNAQFHQDDVRLQEEVNTENQRHDQATEQLQQQQTQMQQTIEQMREANSVQLQQMQEGNQIYMQQGQQAFNDWQTQQSDRMQILSSALNNPWLQQLAGMTPAPGAAGSAVGGANISNLMNQILQPFNVQGWGVENAPASANVTNPAQAYTPPPSVVPSGGLTWDQLSNQLKQAAGQNYNDAAAKALASNLMQVSPDNFHGNMALNLSPDQINQIVQAGSNNQFNTYGAMTAGPQQTQQTGAAAPTGQTAGQQLSGSAPQTGPTMPGQTQAAGTPQVSDPTWSQWAGWNPFQMAAYRTNVEALGPGAWNAQQSQLQQQFAQQGGTPNITAMQAAAATPAQSAGQQMTAEVFGQTAPQWQSQQQKQWSQAQAPQVKQNLTGIAA